MIHTETLNQVEVAIREYIADFGWMRLAMNIFRSGGK